MEYVLLCNQHEQVPQWPQRIELPTLSEPKISIYDLLFCYLSFIVVWHRLKSLPECFRIFDVDEMSTPCN